MREGIEQAFGGFGGLTVGNIDMIDDNHSYL